MPTVRDAAPSDFADLGWTLAKAFAADPLWRFLVPADRPWQHPAARLFAAEVATVTRRGRGRVLCPPGREGAALWSPPGPTHPPPADLLRQAPAALRLFGSRLAVALRALALIGRHRPAEPHWYLAVLGTAPAHQGKGVGSALLAPVLRTCDEEGVPAYLESSNEANLPFYRSQGFVERAPVRLAGGGPPFWPMWREPRPPEDMSQGIVNAAPRPDRGVGR